MRPTRGSCILQPGCRRLVPGAGALFIAAAAGAASPPPGDAPAAVRDAWLDGRLEAAYALNEHLGPFAIEVDVQRGVVHLSGTVESDIDVDLAVRIARAAEGVREVKSRLVAAGAQPPVAAGARTGPRSFAQLVTDATITARVKRNLIANGNTKALAIEVATENDVVTLTGAVASRKDKMLAEMIARNTDGIASVRNQLEIDEPS